ncbi:MAG: MBL fold metallo-hydrolase [Lachnospiraceae bacterium]|nr:MBL fold metallo-hydrolase [Lachnospiraceae bacterium]
MERIIMLGTGSPWAVRCYNSSFLIENNGEYLLVGTGGGNGILRQLADAGISVNDIHNIFLSNGHPDHVMGIVWLINEISAAMRDETYEGDLRVYCSTDIIDLVKNVCGLLLPKKLTWNFDHRIIFVSIFDTDVRKIAGYSFSFFDIRSSKDREFGFSVTLGNGEKLTYAGETPLTEACFDAARGSDWLIHPVYCLHSQVDRYDPYGKGLMTVKEACELAGYLGVPRLIMFSTEDDSLRRREDLYRAEGRLYYKGEIYVPSDLETVTFSQDVGDSV